MDKTTLKRIKENLKSDMKEAGFKTEGSWYIRVVNRQMCQTIDFQGSLGRNCFTFNIGIHPLCDEKFRNYKEYSNRDERIGILMGQGDTWWSYTQESADQVSEIIRNLVLPLFAKCSSYETLFQTMEENRPEKKDRTNPFAVISEHMPLSTLFHLSMMAGAYEKALFYLQKDLEQTEDSIKEKKERKEACPEYLQETSNCLYAQKEKLQKNDTEEILQRLTQNEEVSLLNLAKYVV